MTSIILRRGGPPAPPMPQQPPQATIADYVEHNGIPFTFTRPGDVGAPVIDIPCPPGWSNDRRPPPDVYAAFVKPYPNSFMNLLGPPTCRAHVWKLTGNVDGQAILDVSSGEVKNKTGFTTMGEGPRSFCGYPACYLSGDYFETGQRHVIMQLTVVIESQDGDGLYVPQLAFFSLETEDNAETLVAAAQVVAAQTTITFQAPPAPMPTTWSGTWSSRGTTAAASLTLESSGRLDGIFDVEGVASAQWTETQHFSDSFRVVSAQVLSGDAQSNYWNVTVTPDSLTAYDTANSGSTVSLTPAQP